MPKADFWDNLRTYAAGSGTHQISSGEVWRFIGTTRPRLSRKIDQTHPVGLASPATLQAPLAGPEGNSS